MSVINKVYCAPEVTPKDSKAVKIFLAGTIDDGNSVDWQKKICDKVLDCKANKTELVIYNPRRAEWPDGDNHKEIYRQIEWELNHMDEADIILMNIVGDSKSPISLMEIGIHCHDDKLLVYCPESFYRFDNVKMVCERFDIPLFTDKSADEMIDDFLKRLSE